MKVRGLAAGDDDRRVRLQPEARDRRFLLLFAARLFIRIRQGSLAVAWKKEGGG